MIHKHAFGFYLHELDLFSSYLKSNKDVNTESNFFTEFPIRGERLYEKMQGFLQDLTNTSNYLVSQDNFLHSFINSYSDMVGDSAHTRLKTIEELIQKVNISTGACVHNMQIFTGTLSRHTRGIAAGGHERKIDEIIALIQNLKMSLEQCQTNCRDLAAQMKNLRLATKNVKTKILEDFDNAQKAENVFIQNLHSYLN